MRLGMIGLGRMGANMATRLLRAGHQIVAYDRSAEAVKAAVDGGAEGADSLQAVVEALPVPRIVWVMVPAGQPTQETVDALAALMTAGDTMIDGGNSNYRETVRRGAEMAARGLHFVDVGTSGGVWGLEEGYSLMIGGSDDAVQALRPVFQSLAPAAERGWGHVGPTGSGHFTKMIHNGIEYGMMQALAEGFAILKKKEAFRFDLYEIAEIWRHGSVVRSWLLDLTAAALEQDTELSDIAPFVSDSGEGRWTVAEAIDLDVPAPVITHSLIARLRSRDEVGYGDRLLSAMRNQFGGHAIRRTT